MGFNASLPEGWTAPSELVEALPRETRMAKGGVTLVLCALFLWTAVSLFFDFREAAQEMARTEALRRGSSRETTGEVMRVRRIRWYPDMLSYGFTANGVAQTGECSVSSEHYVKPGDTLPIRFLSSNPAISHPAAWEGPAPGWSMPCLGEMLFLVSGIWFICVLRRDHKLVAEGVPTAGVVRKCSFRGGGVWRAKYEFRTEDGRVAEGSCYSNRLEIGSTVCVLYLPRNPRLNTIYSGLTYRVAQ